MKTLLFFLVSFVAVSAILSGMMMIINPVGGLLNLSIKTLDGTPFNNFLVPGIALAAIVGGTNLLAVFYILNLHASQFSFAITGGIMISGFIVVQIILIHAVSWLHFLYLITGILVILLGCKLKFKEKTYTQTPKNLK